MTTSMMTVLLSIDSVCVDLIMAFRTARLEFCARCEMWLIGRLAEESQQIIIMCCLVYLVDLCVGGAYRDT